MEHDSNYLKKMQLLAARERLALPQSWVGVNSEKDTIMDLKETLTYLELKSHGKRKLSIFRKNKKKTLASSVTHVEIVPNQKDHEEIAAISKSRIVHNTSVVRVGTVEKGLSTQTASLLETGTNVKLSGGISPEEIQDLKSKLIVSEEKVRVVEVQAAEAEAKALEESKKSAALAASLMEEASEQKRSPEHLMQKLNFFLNNPDTAAVVQAIEDRKSATFPLGYNIKILEQHAVLNAKRLQIQEEQLLVKYTFGFKEQQVARTIEINNEVHDNGAEAIIKELKEKEEGLERTRDTLMIEIESLKLTLKQTKEEVEELKRINSEQQLGSSAQAVESSLLDVLGQVKDDATNLMVELREVLRERDNLIAKVQRLEQLVYPNK